MAKVKFQFTEHAKQTRGNVTKTWKPGDTVELEQEEAERKQKLFVGKIIGKADATAKP